jgi:hypothetical protein
MNCNNDVQVSTTDKGKQQKEKKLNLQKDILIMQPYKETVPKTISSSFRYSSFFKLSLFYF